MVSCALAIIIFKPNSFKDAVRTYELTWAIREASELSRAARLKTIAEAGNVETGSEKLSG